MGHSCRTFLWDTLAGLAGLLSDTLVCHSCGTSSKSLSQAGSPIGAHTSSSPAKPFRDSSPSKQRWLTCQSQCHSDIHLHHNSQPHDSLRLPQKLARPHLKHAQSTVPATNCDLRHTSQPHDSLHLAQKLHFHNSKLAQRTAPATKSNNSNIISS